MERMGVLVENGHPTHFTFAVTDTDKNTTAVNQGGSKILVVPFDGVRFDCDNGDQASCAELNSPDGGAGGTAGRGGASGAAGSSAQGGTMGGAGRSGGAGGAPASGGSSGTGGGSATGGSVGAGGGDATGGTLGTGGVSATGGRSGGGTGGTNATGGTTSPGTGGGSSSGCSCSTGNGLPLGGMIFAPLLSVLLARRRRLAARS
jgi:hypothetical protein